MLPETKELPLKRPICQEAASSLKQLPDRSSFLDFLTFNFVYLLLSLSLKHILVCISYNWFWFSCFWVQIVGQFVEPAPFIGVVAVVQNAVTIGQALEATAHTAGDKPVDQSDAAAIQAVEVRATGSGVVIPGGLAASAQSAASFNAGVSKDEDKIKLNDILMVRMS